MTPYGLFLEVVALHASNNNACFRVNRVSEIKDLHEVQTHLNRFSDFTGSLKRISSIISGGRLVGEKKKLSMVGSSMSVSRGTSELLGFQALVLQQLNI